MSDAIWYYVDKAQQRHGPVPAADLAAAFASGDVDGTSLVWREGLPEWMPLAGYREELGLVAAPVFAATEPAPMPPSPSLPPAPAAKSGKGCLVVGLVVGGLVLIGFIAVLAAIALPAYRDYTERVKSEAGLSTDDTATDDGTIDDGTTEDATTAVEPPVFGTSFDADLVAAALAEARLHQGLVDEFVTNTDRCPRDSTEVAIPPVTSGGVISISVGEADSGMCTINVQLGGPGLEPLSGQYLTLSRDTAGDWYCTTTMADLEGLPDDCR